MCEHKLVELFVNCFERDYRTVLSEGFMAQKAAELNHDFARKVVTINNVRDLQNALALARSAVQRGEIDDFLVVEDELPAALRQCGLKLSDLGRIRHYLDFALVAIAAAAPNYLVFCCAEVQVRSSCDWVTDAIKKFDQNFAFFVANPSWLSSTSPPEKESLYRDGPHFVGQGFSDQIFLADAARMALPIYQHTHPDSSRYPMSDVGDIFEKRVDAYMRTEGLLRLTDSRASYIHDPAGGGAYPRAPLWSRLVNRAKRLVTRPYGRKPQTPNFSTS